MIVIVGGGAAGVTAALSLRELGCTDDIRMFGAEPIAPYDRPALSKDFLTGAVNSEPPAMLADGLNKFDVRFEQEVTVMAIDRTNRTVSTSRGEEVQYDQLLFATGAASRQLSVPGSELGQIFCLREYREASNLRETLVPGVRLVIVGGGVIGLEVAASARQAGCEVTVLEVADHVMSRIVPESLSQMITDFHCANGVSIRTRCRLARFEGGDGRVRGIVLADGELIPADAVLVGIGAVPRAEVAAEAGLIVDDGVVVDAYFRTEDDRIFAAGDVARVFHIGERRHVRLEQWKPAQEQGRHAAESMLGLATPYRDVPWMWSDQAELHIQMAGFGFDSAEIIVRGDLRDPDGVLCFALREGRLVAGCGASIGPRVARTIRATQLLIERQATVAREDLLGPGLDLMRLARASRASA